MADEKLTFNNPEQSVMLVAWKMAQCVDSFHPTGAEVPQTAAEIRERLVAEYQTCYKAVLAIHKKIPAARGKATSREY